jgi:hypothetical protein
MLTAEPRSSAFSESARPLAAFALLGFVRLHRGWYLGVVTRARSSARHGPRDAEIQQVVAVDFVLVGHGQPLGALERRQERRFLELLQDVVDSQCLYFSHNYDVTQSAQRVALMGLPASAASRGGGCSGLWQGFAEEEGSGGVRFGSQWARADPRFMWNKHMVQPFVAQGFEEWAHPVMCGLVVARHDLSLSSGAAGPTISYIFISRRAREWQGVRFHCRGLDAAGCAGNFVETEHIVLLRSEPDGVPASSSSSSSSSASACGSLPDERALCAFVQTRGSLPTQWSQEVTTKYTPKVTLHPAGAEEGFERFRRHFCGPLAEHSLDHYGRATAINLIDKVGSSAVVRDQRTLGAAYEALTQRLGDERLRLVWFDFHHECRGGKYENLNRLWAAVRADAHDFGWFSQLRSGHVERWQKGVFRTNCMDNLDRTNVVQTLLARHHLGEALGLQRQQQQPTEQLPTYQLQAQQPPKLPPNVEDAFTACWRLNANTMSVLYAGTPALKTRRGTLGKLQDAFNSVVRYGLNNFRDGAKQDACDLFLGVFRVEQLRPGEDAFAPEPGEQTLYSLIEKQALLFLGTFMLYSVLADYEGPLRSLQVAFAVSFTVGLVAIQHALRRGLPRSFVSKPALHRFKDRKVAMWSPR